MNEREMGNERKYVSSNATVDSRSFIKGLTEVEVTIILSCLGSLCKVLNSSIPNLQTVMPEEILTYPSPTGLFKQGNSVTRDLASSVFTVVGGLKVQGVERQS